MTVDDREGFEPEAAPDDAGDPAVAFDALRHTVEKQGDQFGAEITIIRRGVEAAFDQFEKFQQPTDYGPEFGRIVQQLALIAERLEAVEQSPILRNGPEHYARALERSGESLMRAAAQQLEGKGRDLEREAVNLAACISGARERNRQDRWLVGVGLIGVVVGVLLLLFLPRMLPGSADMAVAATVMNASRWNAGISLMQSGSPGGWRSVINATNLVNTNLAAITVCAEAAVKTNKDQQCTITVAPPQIK